MRFFIFLFSSRRRHTRLQGDWSSDVCSSDLVLFTLLLGDRSQIRVAYELVGLHANVGSLLDEFGDASAHLWLESGIQFLRCGVELLKKRCWKLFDAAHILILACPWQRWAILSKSLAVSRGDHE